MRRACFSAFPSLPVLPGSGLGRAIVAGACALAVAAIGCAEMGTSPNSRIVRAASREVTELPSPDVVRPAVPTATRVAAEENRLPINLDTVFHLAEEQNSQVALARARVQEACAAK